MMKHIILSLMMPLLATGHSFSQKPGIAATSSVVLYLNGALVTDSCMANFEKGYQKMKVIHLCNDFEPEHASILVPDGVKILHLSAIQNDLEPEEYLPEIRSMKDSLKSFEQETERIRDQKQVLQTQLQLLEKNMHFKGEQSTLAIEELKKGMDYYHSALKNIYAEMRALKLLESENHNDIRQIKVRLKEAISKSGYTRKGVEIAYYSNKKKSAPLKIGYTISHAGWSPFYNMRAEDLSEPVHLEHMANTWNRSGKNWYDVKLVLSTANPYTNSSVPQLQKWVVDYYNDIQISGYTNQYVLTNQKPRARSDERAEEAMSSDDREKMEELPTTTVQERILSVDYAVSGKYDLLSTGEFQSVSIKEDTIQGTYRYKSVPKMDRDAFLICAIEDWNRLNLLQGQMNLYLEGNYVGNSQIQTRYSGDSLDLSFGKDPRIVVNRTKSSAFTKNQIIGSKVTERLEFEIKVRNNNKKSVDVELLDQIPISQRSEIEINVIEISGAKLDRDSGKLVWKFKLAPSETKSFKIAFEVKYPKDKNVQIE